MRGAPLAVDAVIPCHDAAAYVGEAIESVLAQTRPVARVIVVDDASRDGTAEVVERYLAAESPVTLLRAPRNGGPSAARNLGVAAGSAPLVAFLDADDRWLPGHCATVAALLEANPSAVLAFGLAEPRGAGPLPAARLPAVAPVDAFWALTHDNPIPQSAAVVRRDALLAAGGYDPDLRHAEDYDLWLRMRMLGPMVRAPDTTCWRRDHPGQASLDRARLYAAGWRARAAARTRFATTATREALARYDRALCVAYDRDLRQAWSSRSFAVFRATVRACPAEVRGCAEVAARWERRGLLWPVWRIAAGVWDRVPASLRAQLRAAP